MRLLCLLSLRRSYQQQMSKYRYWKWCCIILNFFSTFRQKLHATICVWYDLWDNDPEDHREYGQGRGETSNNGVHDRPEYTRTTSSYMKSFRAFKKRRDEREYFASLQSSSVNTSIARGIPTNTVMPPSYILATSLSRVSVATRPWLIFVRRFVCASRLVFCVIGVCKFWSNSWT